MSNERDSSFTMGEKVHSITNDKNTHNDKKSNGHAVLNDNIEYKKVTDKIYLEYSEFEPINKTQENTERREYEKINKNDSAKETKKKDEERNYKF